MCSKGVLQGACLAFTVVQHQENSREGWLFQHVLFLLELRHNNLSIHGAEVMVVWGDTVRVLSWKGV